MASVDFAPSPGCGRKIVVAAAAGADGLVNSSFFVEAAGSPIDVLSRKGTAEEAGINGSVAVFSKADEVVVAAIGGHLVGILGDGKSFGSAKSVQTMAPPTRHINGIA